MTTAAEAATKETELKRLHEAPEILRVVNVWDAITTKVVSSLGATKAIATAGHSIAAAHGYKDGTIPLERLRVACIRDTLHLQHLLVSEPLAREAQGRDDLRVVGEPGHLPFDGAGEWRSPFTV